MSNMAQDSETAKIRLFAGELEDLARKEVDKRLRLCNEMSGLVFGSNMGQLASRLADTRRRLNGEVSALVFGHDVGQLAARLADQGAQVVVDATDKKTPARAGLRTLPFSLDSLPGPDALPEAPFDIIFGQLVLHTQPYARALEAVSKLTHMLKIGGKLYLSAYGLHSMLGDHYPDSGKLVEERFAELPATLADLYNLHGPVCLYSERNLITLLFKVGAPVLQSATGALGNIRAVAVRI